CPVSAVSSQLKITRQSCYLQLKRPFKVRSDACFLVSFTVMTEVESKCSGASLRWVFRRVPIMIMNKRQHQAYYSKILESADHISRRLGRKARAPWKPQLGVILGSGLGEIVEALKPTDEILFSSIPHFPRSSISGHTGVLARGEVGGMSVCWMQGRIHF